MALLPILHYPDARLRRRAVPVTVFDEALGKLAADMAETMYEAPGIGLAATQVNVHRRLIVVDVSEDKSQLLVLVNPEVLAAQGLQEGEEGCLSVPGVYETVARAEQVSVRYQDLTGKVHTLKAERMLAVCIQHEIDHLDGKVFVDYLSRLKQTRIRSKLEKKARITA
jgi:peptide deformylase